MERWDSAVSISRNQLRRKRTEEGEEGEEGHGRGSTELAEVSRGFFVSVGYGKHAEQECAAFHKRTCRIISLPTAQEILDEAHVQKMSAMEYYVEIITALE